MLFHQERSKPRMEKLKAMCEEKLLGKLVEPSSALWEPLSFIVYPWPRLTRFCEVPGVPLDSNLVEQKLIIPVRYLAASFNCKTETGTEVGPPRAVNFTGTVDRDWRPSPRAPESPLQKASKNDGRAGAEESVGPACKRLENRGEVSRQSGPYCDGHAGPSSHLTLGW